MFTPVLCAEPLLQKAANGEKYGNVLQSVEDYCYTSDFNFTIGRGTSYSASSIVK